MVFGVSGGTFGSSTPPSGLTGPIYHNLNNPVNNLTDYQVEFNGFLMGNGTQFRLPIGGIDFLDMASVKTMDVQRVWEDGSFSGPDYADVLLPSVQVKIDGAGSLTQFQSNVTAFRDAFGPQTQAVPLWFKVPGQPIMGLLAKVNQRSVPIDERWLRAGYTIASIQFRCTDPAWQSVPRNVTLYPSAATSGLVYPMFTPATGTYVVGQGVADFGSSGSVTSSTTLWNVGNTPAYPVVTVLGPVAGFSLVMAGNAVTYTGTLGSSDTLVIDYSAASATLNGAADRTTLLSSRQFASVPPNGQATIFYSASSGQVIVTTVDLWR